MKKILSFLTFVLPHAVLVLSIALLVFFVINLFNESMAFLENALTQWILAADAVLSSILAVLTVLKFEHKK